MPVANPATSLVIISADDPLTVGAVLTDQITTDASGRRHRVAFRVVREATWAEWQAQLSPAMRARYPAPDDVKHFYAVAMD